MIREILGSFVMKSEEIFMKKSQLKLIFSTDVLATIILKLHVT